jgi:hypothetical protein
MRRFSRRPAARQQDEALHVVAALDDLDAQRRNLRDRRVNLMRVVSAVRPQEFEPGKAVADFIEHERGSITISDARRMNDDTQRQTLRIDQRMNFAPLHFLAGVIPGQTVMTDPFSADFKD